VHATFILVITLGFLDAHGANRESLRATMEFLFFPTQTPISLVKIRSISIQ
jgi:hypothetical protein